MSLFGNKEYHDEFTGRKGSFDDVISSLNMAKSNGMNTSLNLFAFKDNIAMINDLYETYKDFGIHLAHVAYNDKLQKGTKYRINEIAWQKISDELKETMFLKPKTQKDWLKHILTHKGKLLKRYNYDSELTP